MARYAASSGSSSTRAVVGGGGFPSTSTVIDYVQIATTGDAIDFVINRYKKFDDARLFL